ncbi:MAG TPA: hypothetical protein VM305_00655 [Candidatus Limnocylindrales bacterium]|nr:hypothetical protein [Candidatus Limnocylindrales bacterium]
MIQLVALAALVASVVVGGCDLGPAPVAVDATPAPPSGIRGVVILAPTCPISDEPDPLNPVPCLTPYAAQLVILDSDNGVAARMGSGEDGRFEVDLPPGDYVITPLGGDPFPMAQPLAVTVVAGEYAEVEINYDTGIR